MFFIPLKLSKFNFSSSIFFSIFILLLLEYFTLDLQSDLENTLQRKNNLNYTLEPIFFFIKIRKIKNKHFLRN